jgi:predicted GNAT family N-acyltransferase
LKKTAITRLYFDEYQDLVGYFTLHNDLIQILKAQREKNKWDLANDLKFFPALKIYYLGVDIIQRKKYYGEYLLGEIFLISKEIVKFSGCNFIALEAKTKVTDFYKKYGFTVKENKVKLIDMILNINDL